MKNLIIINGTMGVGKTATCEKLNSELNNSVWLDGDWCWMMSPFVVNDETKSMVIDNITHSLRNFLGISHTENIIFNWVMDKEEIFQDILRKLSGLEFNLYKITLTCSDEVLIKRIDADIKRGKRDKDCIKRSLERQNSYNAPNTIKIDTDNKTIEEVAKTISNIVG
jgi:broad-specificity NMP kinase